MKKSITCEDLMRLVRQKNFESEKEFEDYIKPKITEIFGIENKQVENQLLTTPFDYSLSKRADIVIRSKDEFGRILVVVELKLERNIEKFHKGDWTAAAKQLHKYCQDVRAPYGILMSEEKCLIYQYKWYKDKIDFSNHPKSIPNIRKIEEQAIRGAFIEALIHDKSLKYIYGFLILSVLLGEFGYLTGKKLQQSDNGFIIFVSFLFILFSTVLLVKDLIKKEK